MTLFEALDSMDEKAWAAQLRATRTVTEEETLRRERIHDRDDWTAEELGYGAVPMFPTAPH